MKRLIIPIKYHSKNFLVLMLALQLGLFPAFGYAAPASSSEGGEVTVQTEQEALPAHLQRLVDAANNGETLESGNPGLVESQYRIDYQPDGVRIKRIWDLKKFNIEMDPVAIINFDQQTKIRVVAQNGGEVHIDRYTKKRGKLVRTHTHIYRTPVTAKPVVFENFIALQTPEGLRLILKSQFATIHGVTNIGFNAPVPALMTVPTPGVTIEHVEFLTRASQPRVMTTIDGQAVPGFIHGGDLALRVKETGETLMVDGDVWLNTFTMRWLSFLMLLQVAAPKLDAIQEIASIIQGMGADVAAYNKQVNSVLADASKGNDLLRGALTALAQRSGVEDMAGLARELEGVRQTKRDAFASDPSVNGPWQEFFNLVNEASRAAATGDGSQADTWQDYVLQRKDEALQEAELNPALERKTIRDRIRGRVGKAVRWIASKKALITFTSALSGTVITSHIAPDALGGIPQAMTDWLTQAAASIFNWTIHLDVTQLLITTEKAKEAAEFLGDPTNLAPWVLGTGAIAAMHPLAHLVAFSVAKFRGNKPQINLMGIGRALYSQTMRLYARLNRPIQEGPLRLLGQGNAYLAMDANIPITRRGALEIWPTRKRLARNRERLNESVESHAISASVAQRFAALVVVAERRGISPADLLLQEAAGDVNIFSEASSEDLTTEWMRLSVALYETAREIHDNKDIRMGVDQMADFIEHYSVLAAKLEGTSSADHRRNRFLAACLMGSRNLLAYLAGHDGRQIYLQYRDITPNDETIRRTSWMFGVDYWFSVISWAVIAPRAYANPLMHPRIIAAELEQVAIMSTQIPSDIMPSVSGSQLGALAPPIASRYHAKRRLGRDLVPDRQRPIDLFSAIGIVLGAAANPDPNGRGYLGNWLQWIVNLKNGLQVRLLLAGSALAGGYWADANVNLDGAGGYAAAGLWAGLFILTNKISVQFGTVGGAFQTGGLHIGYAAPWPILTHAMGLIQAQAQENAARVNAAIGSLDRAIEMGDDEAMRDAVAEMKQLYHDGHKTLPSQLNVPSNQYTIEMAVNLLKLARNESPLPTKTSNKFDFLANLMLGSISSTMLYELVNRAMYSEIPGPEQFLWGLGWIGATAGFLYSAKSILRPVNAVTRRVFPRIAAAAGLARRACERHLLGMTPINRQ